jgi:hypothetical protein
MHAENIEIGWLSSEESISASGGSIGVASGENRRKSAIERGLKKMSKYQQREAKMAEENGIEGR